MSTTISEFWNLLAASRLLTPEQLQQLQGDFQRVKGAAGSNAKMLVEWLVSQNALSRYQTQILMAGRSGPFFFGDYKVYDRLDGIGQGTMFRALHSTTGHPVVLQFLSGAITQNANQWAAAVARVQQESGVVHRHIQRCFEPVDLRTHKFLVLEDVRGQSLSERMKGGPLPPGEACNVVRQVALAVAHCHQIGRAHGNLQAELVWMETNGSVKLLSDPLDVLAAQPADRADYMAPELTTAGKSPDSLTDVYSLGCLLFAGVAGRAPFAGGDVAQKMQRHANEAMEPLTKFGASNELNSVASYMMGKNPTVRLQTVAAVIEQITPHCDPALMAAAPVAPPASLGGYESAIRAKQSQLTQTATAVAAAPASNPRLGPRMENVAPSISGDTADGEKPSALAYRRKKDKTTPIILAAVGGAVALVLLLGFFALGGNGDQVAGGGDGEGTGGGNGGAQTNGGGAQGGQTGGSGSQGTGGDGSSGGSGAAGPPGALWAPPSQGAPLTLKYAPPGGQIIFALRPAAMVESAEGKRVLDALDNAMGPGNPSARQKWEEAAGFSFAGIKRLLVTVHGNDGQYPRFSFVVTPKEAISQVDLINKWGEANISKVEGRDILQVGSRAFFIPADFGEKNTFVMGQLEDVREVAISGGAEPALRRETRQLLASTNSDLHFTMLFAPNFFFSDGLPLFQGSRRRMLEPMKWLLGEDLKSGAVSLDFGSYAYGEIRLIGQAEKDSLTLAREMKARVADIPDRLEKYIATQINPPAYWRRVAFRVPSMIDFVHGYTRVGDEDGQAVVNFALPPQAAHNLAFAGAMLVVSQPGGGPAVAVKTPTQTPKTIDELLASKITISFGQNSLEFAARDIRDDIKETYKPTIPFDIKIIGADLQKDGITRNQQIVGFDHSDKSLADVLTALVMKANPITTVKDPSETDQKLIWVVTGDPASPTDKIILITTRAAAAEADYELPKPFQPK